MNRFASVALWAAAMSGAAVVAAPVGPALDRPALASRHAAHSVLLGAAMVGERIVAVGERGIVVLSDDGGTTWRQAPVPVSVTLTAVRFADARHGFAVGHAGTVLSSSDGGETWVRRLDGLRIAELALQAARSSGDAAALKEAERLVADGADKPLLDLWVFDAQRALVVGAYGLVFATDDGGSTWAPWMARLDNRKGLHLYAVRARGDTLLLAGEQGLVLQSTDGGRKWRRLALPYQGSFFTAEILPGGELIVAGLRGNAWRSGDGGASWAALTATMPVSITGSALGAGGAPWFVNQAGFVLGARGGALVPRNAKPLPPLNGLLARPDGSLLALSIDGALPLEPAKEMPK